MNNDKYSEFFSDVNTDELKGESLHLRYVRLAEVPLWGDNPKRHDIQKLINSIQRSGFRDPSEFDATLGAIVAGNGRATALRAMEREGTYAVPRGVLVDKDGNWYISVIFGVDAESQSAARRYGIDHNNLTLLGGDVTPIDIRAVYDTDKYMDNLEWLMEAGDMPVSVEEDDYEYMLEVDLRAEQSRTDNSGSDSSDSGDESDSGGDSDDEPEYVSMTVITMNYNLAGDVFDAIEELLEMNPGWDAKITKN